METLYHIVTHMMTPKRKKCGLVCWKDRDIVYCLTNRTTTYESGSCFHRSQVGLIWNI